jgi:hypothetical protein
MIAALLYLISLRILCWAITKGFKYTSLKNTTVILAFATLLWPILPSLAGGILLGELIFKMYEKMVPFGTYLSNTFGVYTSNKVMACVDAHRSKTNETA